MKSYIVFLGVIFLVFSVLLLSGCEEEKKNNNNNVDTSGFVGEWKMMESTSDDIWLFYSGNTGKRTITTGGQEPYIEFFNWNVDNDQLCITFSGNERCGSYVFSNNFETFTWSFVKAEDTPAVTYTFNKIS